MHYIYQFKDIKDKIIYIGKTINLKQRFASHFSEDGWKKKEVKYIFCAECETQTDMDIYEIYYINKYKPKYNISLVTKDKTSFTLPELEFKEYKEIDFTNISLKNKEIIDFENSRYDLSIMEQRIISSIISNIHINNNNSIRFLNDACISTRLYVKEYINTYNIRNNSIYSDLKNATRNLNYKKIRINNKSYNLAEHSCYDEDKNCILIFFKTNVLDYLLQNIEKFLLIYTTLGLIKNKYTYQIYNIILNLKPNEEITIESFRNELNLNNKYPEYSNVKERIILPCINEIYKVLNIKFSLEEIIINKKVSKVKFIKE